MVSFLIFAIVAIISMIVVTELAAILSKIEDFPYEFLSAREKKWYKYFKQHPKAFKYLKLLISIYSVLWDLILLGGIIFRWICDALHLV